MSREVEAPEVAVVETEEVRLKQPLVLLGFLGPGLVGEIAVGHIIDQMQMKKIAHVRSTYLPPAVIFTDGDLRHPFRIYANEEGTLCSVICELPLYSRGLYRIASTLLDWIEEKDVKELVVLDGVAVRGGVKKRAVFCAAEPDKRKECEQKGVKMITAGVITGIAGSILNECLTRKITGAALLTPVATRMPDPEGAVALIEAINRVYDMKIDVERLLKQAKEIRKKLREFAESHRRVRDEERRKERFLV